MIKKNVLLLETIADEADRLLRSHAAVFEAFGNSRPLEIARSNTIHAIVTRGKGRVNRELMEACPQLEAIARCGVGLDNIEVEEATRRKVKVINAPGSNSDTIAEHTLTLMLMLVRNSWKSVERVKNGAWEWRNHYEGDEIREKTLGVAGMGNIGRRVATLARAFGMNVIYWDKFAGVSGFESCSFEDLFRRSDILTLHIPLLKETEGLIGSKQFGLMKPGSFLINTARGGLIDEDALLTALNDNTLAGFASDVLAVEPPERDHPLTSHPRTLITPHTGSLTARTYRNMCLSTVRNVIAVLSKEEPEPASVFNRSAFT